MFAGGYAALQAMLRLVSEVYQHVWVMILLIFAVLWRVAFSHALGHVIYLCLSISIYINV